MKMNFAIGMGRNERMDEIAELARLADEHGFSHATFVDEPYLARDVSVMATVAALNTKRLIIGQGVVDPQTYHPSAIAKENLFLDSFKNRRPNVMARRMSGIQRLVQIFPPLWGAGISYQPD